MAKWKSWTWVLALGCALGAPAGAADLDGLDDLSLEELLQVEVTSVSRKSELKREAAAAVYVLSHDDLQRSGARTVPDALRMVPGVHVGQIDANKWAVSVRGFNGRFANKLLVLMDGRPLYNPYFSGVFWDTQNVPFEEIERIEVVRGPGATMWGSNAVNGIINIITRSARDTHGWRMEGEAGSRDTYAVTLRQGGVTDSGWHYRATVARRGADDATNVLADDGDDTWLDTRASLRLDRRLNERDTLTAQASYYRGDSREALRLLGNSPYAVNTVTDRMSTSGGWLSAAWERTGEDGNGFRVQGFVENAERDTAWFATDRWTASVGFDQRHTLGRRHDLVWGMSASYSDLPLTSDEPGVLSVVEKVDDQSFRTFELFIQDEVRLTDDFRLIVGSKFEDREYSGFTIQPNVRAAWTLSPRVNVWAAVSRAERSPSRGESHYRVFVPQVLPPFSPLNPGPAPITFAVEGSEAFGPERVTAYEAGLRFNPSQRWEVDVAAYYNDYKDVISSTLGVPICLPSETSVAANPQCVLTSTALQQPVNVGNDATPTARGVEIALQHRMSERLTVGANLSHIEDAGDPPSTAGIGIAMSPRWLANLAADWRIRDDLRLNLGLRYVDEVETFAIPDYLTMDLSIGWRIRPAVRLEVVGRNLLDDDHVEYQSELGESVPAGIRSSVFARLSWAP